jgi:hypothetical protein
MATTFQRAVCALLVPTLLTSGGCLSSSYRIPRGELERLAQTPPDQRWQGLRATQQMFGSDTPPSSGVTYVPQPQLIVYPDVFAYRGRSYNVPRAYGSGRGPGVGAVGASGRSGSGSSSSSGSGSSGGGGSSGGSFDPKAVVVVVVLAAVVVFVLAGSEGARYDGWLVVNPNETLFLDGDDGSTTALPLSMLTPEVAARASGATIYEGRDDRYVQIERAPLNRVGFTLQSGASLGLMPSRDASEPSFGFGGRAFFGGFPLQQLGLGVSADVMGGGGGLYAGVGGEIQFMPITWAGVYGGGGWASYDGGEGFGRRGGYYVNGGVQLELPFTTRCTGQLRGGVGRVDLGDGYGAVITPGASLGLAIY